MSAQVQFEAADECNCSRPEPVRYSSGTYCDACGGRIADHRA